MLLTQKWIFEVSIIFIIKFYRLFTERKQSNLSRLMGCARGHKILTIFLGTVSHECAVGSCAVLVYMAYHSRYWKFPGLHRRGMSQATAGLAGIACGNFSLLSLYRRLMFAHERIPAAANIRKELRHITALPLGCTEKYGSGNLAKGSTPKRAATEPIFAQAPGQSGKRLPPLGCVFFTVCILIGG